MKNKYINKKIISLLVLIIILSAIIPTVNSSGKIYLENKNEFIVLSKGDTLYVGGSGPGNYSTIQAAINDAVDGDTIFVFSGTYHEHIIVNKMITLIGENKQTTIIEGDLTDNIVVITANLVTVKGLTIKKGIIGVYIASSSNQIIKNNIIKTNWEGVGLYQVSGATITENSITDNYFEGINPVQSNSNTFSKNVINWNIYGILFTQSNNNYAFENEIRGNTRGMDTLEQSSNNKIYHNNFYESVDDNAFDDFSNIWDDDYPSGGNYWDDYNGIDSDGDGIGDTSYNIPGDGNNKDHYPLMEPFIPTPSNQPPNKPIITGPTKGIPGVEYTYCISEVTDPEQDLIYVYWDWDDGTNSGWLGPYASGEQVCASHSWDSIRTYIIKAKLKDAYGEESETGELVVMIPRARNINLRFLDFFNFHLLFNRILNHLIHRIII